MIRHLVVSYDNHEYDFHRAVLDILEWPLQTLHLQKDYDLFEREQDQSSIWHEKFYQNNESFIKLYYNFISNWVSKVIAEDFVFQAVPTFRVHLPNNLAVGEAHRDFDYGHSPHSMNFWVPLTPTNEYNTIHIGRFVPIMKEGQMLIFDGANLLHWNEINKSSLTRVSFDFRVIPNRFFSESRKKTINGHKEFKIGSYYDSSY